MGTTTELQFDFRNMVLSITLRGKETFRNKLHICKLVTTQLQREGGKSY